MSDTFPGPYSISKCHVFHNYLIARRGQNFGGFYESCPLELAGHVVDTLNDHDDLKAKLKAAEEREKKLLAGLAWYADQYYIFCKENHSPCDTADSVTKDDGKTARLHLEAAGYVWDQGLAEWRLP